MFHWLRAGLEDLGHEVTLSHTSLSPSGVNVLWEGFTPESGEMLRASGVRYGIIVTEFMDGTGFNKGTPRSDQIDRRDEAYRRRWLGFQAAASRASFFWSMVESNVPVLRDRAPASFIELGFSDRLVPATTEEPQVDFSFTGILTPYRQRVLETLAKRAHVVCHGTLIPLAERDKLFRATRINLSINKTIDWEMPSPTRVGLALLCKRGIALDLTPQTTRQSRLVSSRLDGVDYVDYALERLDSDWRAAAAIGFERYRAELPMREIMVRVLDESRAGTGNRRLTSSIRPWIKRVLGRVRSKKPRVVS